MPNPDMEELDRKVGGPIASYTLDDLRRMFLRGQAAPAATPGAMPADVEAMIPTPITDALRGPPMPGPVTSAPLPTLSPEARAALSRGTPPQPVMPPPPAPPVPAAAMAAMTPAEPPPFPGRSRLTPEQYADVLRRLAPRDKRELGYLMSVRRP